VRVPALDPKYKIAVLASKQVCIIITPVMLHRHIHRWKQIPLRSIEFNSRVEMV
jgi:hypothetical protein